MISAELWVYTSDHDDEQIPNDLIAWEGALQDFSVAKSVYVLG